MRGLHQLFKRNVLLVNFEIIDAGCAQHPCYYLSLVYNKRTSGSLTFQGTDCAVILTNIRWGFIIGSQDSTESKPNKTISLANCRKRSYDVNSWRTISIKNWTYMGSGIVTNDYLTLISVWSVLITKHYHKMFILYRSWTPHSKLSWMI